MSRDPELNRLASELAGVNWIEPLGAEEWAELHRVATLPPKVEGAYRRRVNAMPGYRYWAVRIYLGGEVRAIGYVSTNRLPDGMRFADMAAMYFWKYRIRGACEPSENELNRSVADVKRDLIHETHAVALLKRIEEHLLQTDAILSPERRAQLVKERKVKNRGGLRVQLLCNQAELLEYLKGIHHSINQLHSFSRTLQDEVRAGFAKQEEAFRLLVGALRKE